MQRRSVRRINQAGNMQQDQNNELNNTSVQPGISSSISNNGSQIVNADVITLLQSISTKLDKLSLQEESVNTLDNSNVNNSLQSQQLSTELRDLFAKILSQQNASNQVLQDVQQNAPNQVQQDVQQSASNQVQQNVQQNASNQVQQMDVQQNIAIKNEAKAVQTAAQVLSEAQYELSNELEASLTKLQKVIQESEKVANNISRLLGKQPTST